MRIPVLASCSPLTARKSLLRTMLPLARTGSCLSRSMRSEIGTVLSPLWKVTRIEITANSTGFHTQLVLINY